MLIRNLQRSKAYIKYANRQRNTHTIATDSKQTTHRTTTATTVCNDALQAHQHMSIATALDNQNNEPSTEVNEITNEDFNTQVLILEKV